MTSTPADRARFQELERRIWLCMRLGDRAHRDGDPMKCSRATQLAAKIARQARELAAEIRERNEELTLIEEQR